MDRENNLGENDDTRHTASADTNAERMNRKQKLDMISFVNRQTARILSTQGFFGLQLTVLF
jgi:hypothetical protein